MMRVVTFHPDNCLNLAPHIFEFSGASRNLACSFSHIETVFSPFRGIIYLNFSKRLYFRAP